jgi:hypothetical protein
VAEPVHPRYGVQAKPIAAEGRLQTALGWSQLRDSSFYGTFAAAAFELLKEIDEAGGVEAIFLGAGPSQRKPSAAATEVLSQ